MQEDRARREKYAEGKECVNSASSSPGTTLNSPALHHQLGQVALKRLNLDQEEEALEIEYTKLLQVEKELGDNLKEKYGDSQIDLKTGEITQS